jgi:FkbM family methyltransferase
MAFRPKSFFLRIIRIAIRVLGPRIRTSLISVILEEAGDSKSEKVLLLTKTELVRLIVDDFKDSIPGWHYLNKSFSQNGEDLAIQRLMEHHPIGKYIDIGAHHPFRFSNTALLNLQGWEGTNVDPNPESFKEFIRARPKDNNVCAALGSQTSMMSYYEFDESALNTFSQDLVKRHSSQGLFPRKVTQTQVIEAKQFLEQLFTADTFFLSVDAEGMDIEILRDLDFRHFHPCWIVMENQSLLMQDLEEFILSNSFLTNYHIRGLVGNSIILCSSGCSHVAS